MSHTPVVCSNARAQQAEKVRLTAHAAWLRRFAFHLDDRGLPPVEAGAEAWQDIQAVFDRLRTEADPSGQGELSTEFTQDFPQDIELW
jgi:hypothetical protein